MEKKVQAGFCLKSFKFHKGTWHDLLPVGIETPWWHKWFTLLKKNWVALTLHVMYSCRAEKLLWLSVGGWGSPQKSPHQVQFIWTLLLKHYLLPFLTPSLLFVFRLNTLFCFVNLGSFIMVLETMAEHTLNLLLHSAVLSHLSHKVVETSSFHSMYLKNRPKAVK